MSYNPARQQGGVSVNPRRQRRLDPRAGIRHSEIIAKQGPSAATMTDMRNRVETPRGWRSVMFCGDDFEMIFEYICSKNSTGGLLHPEKDRVLRLMAGELYVTMNDETVHLRSGSSFILPKGIEYKIATSGTLDAEIIFCQGANYEKDLEQRSEPEAISAETKMSSVGDDDVPVRQKTSTEQTRQQAEKIAEERRQRDIAKRQGLPRVVDEQSLAATSGAESVAPPSPRRTPPRRVLPGQQVTGVNPRPMGAGGPGEDD